MYLSCLMIDLGNNPDRPRPGRLWLRKPYRVHQRLCMAFPSAEQKTGDPLFLKPFDLDGFQHVHALRTREQSFLFRIDPLTGGRAMIVVQSALKPDWDYAFQNASHLLAARPEVRLLDANFHMHQHMLFRLRANPTRRDKETRKRQGVLTEEKQREWLQRKGRAGGFEPVSVTVIDESFHRDFRTSEDGDRERMSHLVVRYDGVLKVTDPAAFRETIVTGVGSAKGFGFGLLSVAPLRDG